MIRERVLRVWPDVTVQYHVGRTRCPWVASKPINGFNRQIGLGDTEEECWYDITTAANFAIAETDAGIEKCSLPPRGWICPRGFGHDGPCATHRDPCDAEEHSTGIKRFDLNPHDGECGMVEDERGDYISWDDHLSAIQSRDQYIETLREELDPCCRNPRCGGECTCKICAPDLYVRDIETELTELKEQCVGLREALAFIAYGKQHTGVIPCPQDYHFYIRPFRDRAREALDGLSIPEEKDETAD